MHVTNDNNGRGQLGWCSMGVNCGIAYEIGYSALTTNRIWCCTLCLESIPSQHVRSQNRAHVFNMRHVVMEPNITVGAVILDILQYMRNYGIRKHRQVQWPGYGMEEREISVQFPEEAWEFESFRKLRDGLWSPHNAPFKRLSGSRPGKRKGSRTSLTGLYCCTLHFVETFN